MTTPRDPDAQLAAYLADGMDVLPDRVVDAVLDEVHRTRQRTVFGPWRIPTMFKTAVGAAAVIAVLVLGGAVYLGAFRTGDRVGGPPASPSASATASPGPAASASAELPAFPLQNERLEPGVYQVKIFSQPMTLTIPDAADEFGPGQRVNGHIYGGGFHTMQINFEPINASITIHDDFRINTDLCRLTPDVQEVPETPEAVGIWLHGLTDVEVTDQPDLTVDGRSAKVYDLVLGPTCGSDDPPGSPDVWFGANETHRIYAIPTGTDTILVFTWNLGRELEQARLNEITDRFVERLAFD